MTETDEIFKFFGGRKALAKKLNCTPQAFTSWKNGVPPQAAIEIEKLSGGHFKAVNIKISSRERSRKTAA